MITIGSSVLVTCNSIDATTWCDTLCISSALAPEDNCMEVPHAWVFVVKLEGLRGGSFFHKSIPGDVAS